MFDDTIVAETTPPGTAGVSIIRISGSKTSKIGKILTKSSNVFFVRKPLLCNVYSREQEVVDQALITFFKAPKSYTGEDILEIACHGNPLIVREIIKTACKHGARSPNPGEFTMRSFLNGKMDLEKLIRTPSISVQLPEFIVLL